MNEQEKSTKQEKASKEIEEMLQVSAFIGCIRRKRHPSVSPFILFTKKGVDFINLEKTEEMIKKALDFVKDLASKEKKTILFVGTKPEARKIIEKVATELNLPFVNQRWIGGTLTNFKEIRKKIDSYLDLKNKFEKGETGIKTKKEKLLIERKIKRSEKYFNSLVNLKELPQALFIVDPLYEKNAVTEAVKKKIPVIALLNTDCNIKKINYPILANDSIRKSIEFFVKKIAQTYLGR